MLDRRLNARVKTLASANFRLCAIATDFWSFIAYDNQTRSMVQTDQQFPGIGSKDKSMVVNADGSVDVWFGPTAPTWHEKNWVQTVPGRGWNVVMRLYGRRRAGSTSPGSRVSSSCRNSKIRNGPSLFTASLTPTPSPSPQQSAPRRSAPAQSSGPEWPRPAPGRRRAPRS